MKKYTHVIWDFNGTILDDLQIGIDAVNVMLKKRSLPTIDSIEDYRKIFGFPIKEYYRRCGFDFDAEDYESILAPEWVAEYKKRESDAELCCGVLDAIRSFESASIRQSVVSASSSDMLHEQIERLGIVGYFDSIIGCDNFFAYGKVQLCREFVASHSEDVFILVGDSTHDYESAVHSGIDCALVLSGHMSRETLSKCGCPLFEDARSFAEYVIGYNG